MSAAPYLRVVEAPREILFDVEAGWPLIPDATYLATCNNVETRHTFRTPKCYLTFEIADGEHQGKELFKAYNVGKAKQPGSRPTLGRKSHLFKDLCRLLNLPINTRPHRVSPSELRGKLYRITSRTVTTDYEQKPLPDAARYSTVGVILAIEA